MHYLFVCLDTWCGDRKGIWPVKFMLRHFIGISQLDWHLWMIVKNMLIRQKS